jgi:hypothetical protein
MVRALTAGFLTEVRLFAVFLSCQCRKVVLEISEELPRLANTSFSQKRKEMMSRIKASSLCFLGQVALLLLSPEKILPPGYFPDH